MAGQEFIIEELESEEWRPCGSSFTGYEVSNLGRVRSLRYGVKSRGTIVVLRPRLCKGYFVVGLSGTPQKRTVPIHTLVAQAFISGRPDGHQVNHRNGNRSDNRATNLEYVTPQQNLRHAQEIGLVPAMLIKPRKLRRKGSCNLPVLYGADNPRAKLTADDVREIRQLRANDASYAEIASRFGIAKDYVASIVSRRRWSHI